MQSTGLVLAAGGIAAVNEVVFAPLADKKHNPLGARDNPLDQGNPLDAFNWRIIPATAVLALTLGALETLSPQFAKILAGLAVFTVLVTPVGNAAAPIDNLTRVIGA